MQGELKTQVTNPDGGIYSLVKYGTCYSIYHSYAHHVNFSNLSYTMQLTDELRMGYHVFTVDGVVVHSGHYFVNTVDEKITAIPFAPLQRSDTCVVTDASTDTQGRRLIAGGTEVANGKAYRFMGSITDARRNHICGGTLVASDKLLTAAHCFSQTVEGWPYYMKPVCNNDCAYNDAHRARNSICDDVSDDGEGYCKLGSDCDDCGVYVSNNTCANGLHQVTLGTVDIDAYASNACAEVIPLKSVDGYPTYAATSGEGSNLKYFSLHDMAIITLAGGSGYSPIALYTGNVTNLIGASVVALGWGHTYQGGVTVDNLRSVSGTVQCVGNACYQNQHDGCYSSNIDHSNNNELCVRYGIDDVGGACKGDSGGPVVLIGDELLLVGVVSYMKGTCGSSDARYYAMNVADPEHADWLRSFQL
ncbi:hypothetical protein CYMTET_40933 [Cymbomonas tetramitiformis]|uniref:Peptidase S1 domain-containing protein n=1 Tax=Cymbomonas tetramitiformis TaxID=36881 RepID=A0AAE0F2R5_9CHLO|nr:hypothetical protein CYMTET_40933 [Cymbomonas tetramitiformis]